MQLHLLLATLFSVPFIDALQSPHRKQALLPRKRTGYTSQHQKRQVSASPPTQYLNPKSKPFVVNGSAIPEVPFDAGESYAGTLSISANASDANRLFFWFWPSDNPKAKDEITIWLNGGPGCSSLDGFFQENGKFLWQSGTYQPILNPYSWTNLTNVVYIDQPIGTGFSPYAPGAPAQIMNETQVAAQFMGFWKNFMDTFNLNNRKVYITGESYAGQYIPYIASAMLDTNNTEYYKVKGVQINDGSINYDDTLQEAPAVGYVREWANIFNLNSTFMARLNNASAACGYDEFIENSLQFPPKGLLPTAPSSRRSGCQVFDDIVFAALYVNPCFNFYHITDYCPFLWDELGFPSLGFGPNNYFNRTDVQKALNVPLTNYAICGDPTLFPHGDRSIPSGLGPLPSVIDRTKNVIIGHGLLDFLLMSNGSLITIQNMTWGSPPKQGFQTRPTEDNFFVPYHETLGQIIQEVLYQGNIPSKQIYANSDVAGAGILGSTHTERGLTFVTVKNAGHEIPQYQAGAAYRQLEFLLGRIDSLTMMGDYTTQSGNFTGNGTFYI